MEKESKEYSLETLPILVEQLQTMLKETKVLELHGEMGAGKTTLVIELLKKMGVQDPEGSPTYSLINEYLLENGSKIYHIDAFRINTSDEAFELGLDELFEENAFFFVEWAEKIINFLPERRIKLTITTNASLTRTYSIPHDHGS
ncbi:MAG: tRNA (adenosine(37)-N6)-threonylcarbamoyltransferase complex ATPase subunit type 1 TsaE [Flavobacteriales bacterium]